MLPCRVSLGLALSVMMACGSLRPVHCVPLGLHGDGAMHSGVGHLFLEDGRPRVRVDAFAGQAVAGRVMDAAAEPHIRDAVRRLCADGAMIEFDGWHHFWVRGVAQDPCNLAGGKEDLPVYVEVDGMRIYRYRVLATEVGKVGIGANSEMHVSEK